VVDPDHGSHVVERDEHVVGPGNGCKGMAGTDHLDPATVSCGGLHQCDDIDLVAGAFNPGRGGTLVAGPVAP